MFFSHVDSSVIHSFIHSLSARWAPTGNLVPIQYNRASTSSKSLQCQWRGVAREAPAVLMVPGRGYGRKALLVLTSPQQVHTPATPESALRQVPRGKAWAAGCKNQEVLELSGAQECLQRTRPLKDEMAIDQMKRGRGRCTRPRT